MSTFVLYHHPCWDGHGAAWAAKRYIDTLPGGKETQYVGVTYGQPMPEIPDGSDIMMLDFSYKRAEMEVLRARSASLLVIDHHKSAQIELEGFPNTVFDMDHSGAYLTWEFFFPDKPVPSLLRYVEDRDMWWHKLPKTHEINAWIASYPKDFEVWDCLANDIGQVAIVEGAAILRFKDQKVQEIADHATLVEWQEYGMIPAVNTSCLMSEVAAELLVRHPETKFSCYWFDTATGDRQWGLRSVGEFDVSTVAKKNGGGGHKHAAGFVTKAGEDVEGIDV